MITDWLSRATGENLNTPVSIGEIDAVIHGLAFDEEVREYHEDEVVTAELEQVDVITVMIYSVLDDLKKLSHVDETVAKLTHSVLDTNLNRIGLTISMDDLFTRKEDSYEVSMEGISFTWQEVFRFLKKATQVILDTLRAFLGRRFTFMGKSFQDARQLKKMLPKLQLANANELLNARIKLNGAALWLIDENLKQPQESINQILRKLPTIAGSLDPRDYRVNLDQVITTLEGSRTSEPKVVMDMVKLARTELYKALCAYLACNITETNNLDMQMHASERLPGWQRFTVAMPKEGFIAPRVKLETINTRKKVNEFTMRPIDTHMGAEYARVAEAALDQALLLRQDYEKFRDFKRRCDNTAKALKDRVPEDAQDRELVSIFRQVPSYARCFNEPLKVKNELVYRYCTGLLKVIQASRPEWQVRV